jgi:hypothetical protein
MGMMWLAHMYPVWILELKIFGHHFISFALQFFCKASNGTSNATKIIQIDEGMNKICLF